MQVRAGEKFGSCGCGRSPDGNCCGWHGLSEDAYKAALEEYNINEAAKLIAEETLQATDGNCTCGRTQDPNGNCDGSHLFTEQD